MRGDQQLARQCFMMATKVQKASKTLTAKQLFQREPKKRKEPTKQLITFSLKDHPSRMVQVRSSYLKKKRSTIGILALQCRHFSWWTSIMPRIPWGSSLISEYRSKVQTNQKKKRNFAPKRHKTINKKVNKLLATRFIREAHYLIGWLILSWSKRPMKSEESVSTILISIRHAQ